MLKFTNLEAKFGDDASRAIAIQCHENTLLKEQVRMITFFPSATQRKVHFKLKTNTAKSFGILALNEQKKMH